MIYIAADHRGFELKNQLKNWLLDQGYKVTDCGSDRLEPEDDYTDVAKAVSQKILSSIRDKTDGQSDPSQEIASAPKDLDNALLMKNRMYEGAAVLPEALDEEISTQVQILGILICGSGIGMCITANRFKGIRCGLAHTPELARHARENDHINILSIPADILNLEQAQAVAHAFIQANPIMKEKYIRRAKKNDIF